MIYNNELSSLSILDFCLLQLVDQKWHKSNFSELRCQCLIRITPPLGSFCDYLAWIATASMDITNLENRSRIAENEINSAYYEAISKELNGQRVFWKAIMP